MHTKSKRISNHTTKQLMRFKLIRFSGWMCFFLMIALRVDAQADSLIRSKVDSLPKLLPGVPSLKTEVQQSRDVLKQEVKSLLPSAPLKMAGNNNPASTAISKVKLLAGGKPFGMQETTLSAGYSYPQDTSGIALGGFRSMQGIADYSVHGGFSTMNIPFSVAMDANKGFYSNGQPPLNDFYAVNFDPEKYKELLQKEVLAKIKPEQVLNTLMSRIDNIRHGYEQKLLNELSSIQQDFKDRSGELVAIPTEITDLSKTDLTSIRSSIFKDQSPGTYEEQVRRLQQIESMGAAADTSAEKKKVAAAVGRYKAMEKMFAAFKNKKNEFDDNKVVRELKSHLPFTPDKFSEYLSKPGNLRDVISQYGSLSGLQSIFLSLTKMDLGQNPVQNGELNMKGLLNTGLNTAFESKKAKAGFIVGKNNNVNNWMQGGLNSIVGNEYSGMTGFSIGTGTSSRSEQSVSLNLFNFVNTPGMSDPLQQFQTNYLANAPRQDAVITYHAGFKAGSKHEIKVDLSRSFGSYRNQMTEDSSSVRKSATGGLFNDEGKANYAAMVNYDGEIFSTPIQVMVKKVGLGYNNPGNIFLRRGETQVQFALNRKFLKQKLNLRYKTDYRHQQFDPEKRFIANTFSNKLQANYRFKKNTRAGLSYQRSDYRTTNFYQADGSGVSSILQADASYRFTLAGKKISNTSTISHQVMNLPMSTGASYRNTTLLAVHTSSIPLQKNMLLLTLMGNQSKSKEYYFNTGFVNTEASYVYTISNMRLSSGTGYYFNEGWNTQVGLKQSVTATLIKKLELDINVDYKKAVRIIRPELANQLLIYSSVRYRF